MCVYTENRFYDFSSMLQEAWGGLCAENRAGAQLQCLGAQVLSVGLRLGPDQALGSHWSLEVAGKTELLDFSFVLVSAHPPPHPTPHASLYGAELENPPAHMGADDPPN